MRQQINRPVKQSRASRKAAAPFRRRLVIMAKAPVAGRVKTRLARQVGVAEACRFYRTASRTVLARLSRQPFWETIVAVDTVGDLAHPVWPRGVSRMHQGRGELGARMHKPMRTLPPGPVCVVGTDVPGIGAGDVRRAFRLLGNHDMAFGPAEDGGFWLVGARRRPRVFYPYAGVRWSQSTSLAQTLANLGDCRVAFTTRHHDVDDAGDLARATATFGRRVRSGDHPAPPQENDCAVAAGRA
ncbi:MAG: glycosyltransferase [Hyphomicrobiaceae bacterium]